MPTGEVEQFLWVSIVAAQMIHFANCVDFSKQVLIFLMQ